MILVIPANTTMDRFGEALPALSAWLKDNNVWPANVSGLHELSFTTDQIAGSDRLTGDKFFAPIIAPMPEELLGYLAARFGASYGEGDVVPDNADQRLSPDGETASLDDVAQLIDQLRQARADSKAAKEREDEAKLEIMARLKSTGKEYGSVNGQRVVHAKTVKSNTFQTVKFRSVHPELAAEFTEEKTSIRLEIV